MKNLTICFFIYTFYQFHITRRRLTVIVRASRQRKSFCLFLRKTCQLLRSVWQPYLKIVNYYFFCAIIYYCIYIVIIYHWLAVILFNRFDRRSWKYSDTWMMLIPIQVMIIRHWTYCQNASHIRCGNPNLFSGK